MHYKDSLDAIREIARTAPASVGTPIIQHVTHAYNLIDQRVSGLLNSNSSLVTQIRAERRKREEAEQITAVLLSTLANSMMTMGATQTEIGKLIADAREKVLGR